tara:strand:+ start:744 stop:1454 length:711 start_codon:yes stop_codon:yes gene_type:complete
MTNKYGDIISYLIVIAICMSPKKVKANVYNKFFEILLFMSFNQFFIYGDYRGLLVLLGTVVNYIFYMILNKTTAVINAEDANNIPSLSTQMIFFFIGFQIAHMTHKSKNEFSYAKIIYLIVFGLMALFITKVVDISDLNPGENTSGRILGAMFGIVVGIFYYMLVNYKYSVRGEDVYSKQYSVCKNNKQYNCQVNDYEKIKNDVRESIINDPNEEEEVESLFKGAFKDPCNSGKKK